MKQILLFLIILVAISCMCNTSMYQPPLDSERRINRMIGDNDYNEMFTNRQVIEAPFNTPNPNSYVNYGNLIYTN